MIRPTVTFLFFSFLFFLRFSPSSLIPTFSSLFYAEELTEAEEDLIGICEDFKRDCHPDDQSSEFFSEFQTGVEAVVTCLCANHKTVQLSFIRRVERALDLMNRATEVLKETMNEKLGKKQVELVEDKSTLSEQILSKLIDSLKQLALNAQDEFVSQTFWSYASALGKISGRTKTKVNVFIQDAEWDSGRQELVAHEVVLIVQELQETIDDISATLETESALIERNQYKHLFEIAMESFQAGTTPEKATEVQILKDKLSAVKKVEFYEAITEHDVFASLKDLAVRIDQILNGIEELETVIEEQDAESCPTLVSMAATLVSKLEATAMLVLEDVIKGWEVKVDPSEVQELKSLGGPSSFFFCLSSLNTSSSSPGAAANPL